MKLFRDASIKRKQVFIIMLTTSVALLLACVAWRLPVIRSVKTLPTLKAEAVTPYSSDSQ